MINGNVTATGVEHMTTSPSMKPWRGEGAYLTRRFQPGASTRTAGRSDAAMFKQNKQIFLSTLPRTGFNTKICSYLRSAYDVVRTEGDVCWTVNKGPMFGKQDVL